MREQSDPKRPCKGQRQCKINWAYQPDDQNKRTIQALLRDVGVPAPICQKVSKIDKNVYKTKLKKLNRVVRSPFGNPRTLKTKVSNGPAENSNEKRKTYREKKKETYRKKRNLIRAIEAAQRNGNLMTNTEVSYSSDKRRTYQEEDSRDHFDRERPHEGQNPQRNQNPSRVVNSNGLISLRPTRETRWRK
jgi:hypothetical protein